MPRRPGPPQATSSPESYSEIKNEAAQHVRPVKAGHGEDRAGEAVGGEGQAAIECVDELVQLAELEGHSQDDGQDPEREKSAPVVVRQAVEREVAGHTAGKQDHSVQRGDAEQVA